MATFAHSQWEPAPPSLRPPTYEYVDAIGKPKLTTSPSYPLLPPAHSASPKFSPVSARTIVNCPSVSTRWTENFTLRGLPVTSPLASIANVWAQKIASKSHARVPATTNPTLFYATPRIIINTIPKEYFLLYFFQRIYPGNTACLSERGFVMPLIFSQPDYS